MSKKNRITEVILIVTIIAFVLIRGLWVKYALSSAVSAYSDSLKLQREETYQTFYDTSFDIAEKKYHIVNEVKISVEDVRETAELEVLQVSDIEYVFNKGNTQIWTAVKGHGVYTVNLSLGEFLVDNVRQYVLVRIPYPKLSTAGLDYEYESYLFENGIFNGNTKDGVDKAREDLKAAQNQLQAKLVSNQFYYETAQKSAEDIIRSLVMSCNPSVADLVVKVEFVE